MNELMRNIERLRFNNHLTRLKRGTILKMPLWIAGNTRLGPARYYRPKQVENNKNQGMKKILPISNLFRYCALVVFLSSGHDFFNRGPKIANGQQVNVDKFQPIFSVQFRQRISG